MPWSNLLVNFHGTLLVWGQNYFLEWSASLSFNNKRSSESSGKLPFLNLSLQVKNCPHILWSRLKICFTKGPFFLVRRRCHLQAITRRVDCGGFEKRGSMDSSNHQQDQKTSLMILLPRTRRERDRETERDSRIESLSCICERPVHAVQQTQDWIIAGASVCFSMKTLVSVKSTLLPGVLAELAQ